VGLFCALMGWDGVGDPDGTRGCVGHRVPHRPPPPCVPCLRTDRCPQGWAKGEVAPQAAQSGTIRGVRRAPITVTLGIRSACPFRGEGRRPPTAEAASPGSVHRAREPGPDPARAGLEERVSAAVGASQGRMSLLFLVCSAEGRNPYSPRVENSTARSSPSAARSWRFLNTNIGS